MRPLKFVKMAVGIALCSATGMLAANAHPVVAPSLPLHHIVKLLPSKFLALHGSVNSQSSISALLRTQFSRDRFSVAQGNALIRASSGIPLSGSRAAFLIQIKTLTGSSIYNTETQIGPIISGQTYSTVYVSQNFNGGTFLTRQPNEIDEFGAGNPLNTGGAAGTVTIANTNPYFNFGPSPIQTSVTGTILAKGAVVPVKPLSGAMRSLDNFYNSVVRNGVNAGTFLRSHPIGGVLEGTYYYPSSYYPVSFQLLAFGNSPLNNPAIQSAIYNQNGSYLQFANKVIVHFTTGQFLSTYYFAGSGPNKFTAQAYNFDVFGSNPLNVSLMGHVLGANYPFTVPYYLY
jgi:hypothetical protein